ncbi:MAG: hypothetical protein J6B45_04645 [Clostridia bacterium]|nr:hypothetical protein [Clostridia bacterium]
MKKLLPILFVLLFILTSCRTPHTNTVTGESTKAPYSHNEGKILYIANTSSKTYHLPSCYIAKRIKEENRFETRDVDFLRSRKFTACKTCIKIAD